MKIKFTKNHPDAVMPIRATSGAAGFDLITGAGPGDDCKAEDVCRD